MGVHVFYCRKQTNFVLVFVSVLVRFLFLQAGVDGGTGFRFVRACYTVFWELDGANVWAEPSECLAVRLATVVDHNQSIKPDDGFIQ